MSALRRNIVYNVVGQVVVMGLGLVAVRLVFRQLGADAFGVMLFAQSLGLVLASVLDLGLSATIVREVAGQIDSDKEYVWDLLRTATLLYWAAYLVVTLAIMLSAPLLASHWLTLHELDVSTATGVMQILGAGVLLVLPRSLYASFFRGLQRMDVTNVIEVGALLLQLAGTIVILIGHGGIFQVAWWFTATYAASVLAYVAMTQRAQVPWRALLPQYRPSVARRNVRFVLHMTSVSALGALHGQMDKLLVSKLMAVAALGAYGFASTMVAGGLRIVSSIFQAVLPAFAELARRGDHEALLRRYQRVHTLITRASAPLFAGITFAAPPVFHYVLGDAISQSLMLPTALLCAGSFMNAGLIAPYAVSLAMGRPDIAAKQNTLALVLVWPLAILGVWRFGLAGAGASWIVYHLFAYAYGLPRISRQCLRIPPGSVFVSIARVMVIAVVLYGPALLGAFALGSSLPVLALSFALATIAYAAIATRLLPGETAIGKLLEGTLLHPPAKAA